MGCNVAHYFYRDILPFVNIPFLSILDETCRAVRDAGYKKVALLACGMTLKSGVYLEAMDRFGIDCIRTTAEEQACFDCLIYDGIKKGDHGGNTKKSNSYARYRVMTGTSRCASSWG